MLYADFKSEKIVAKVNQKKLLTGRSSAFFAFITVYNSFRFITFL
jgi:hypothetical protein